MNYDNYIRRQKRNGTKNNNFIGIRVPGFYAANLDDRQQNAGTEASNAAATLEIKQTELATANETLTQES